MRRDSLHLSWCAIGTGLLAVGLTVGCSSTAIESEMPARVTVSANPIQRTIRPVPDVITKPKPFRLPDSSVAANAASQPVTMQAPQMQASQMQDSQPLSKASQQSEAPSASATPLPAIGEIRAMMRGYRQAFNQHNPEEIAAHWSRTGENIDLDSGETTTGREAVENVFSTLFEEDAGAAIDINIETIRPLRDDVAMIDGVSLITFTQEPPSSSRFSAVVVKQDGRWMLESVREAALSVPTNTFKPLDQLAWLVGSWEDIGEGVTAGTHCFWSSGHAFLIRSHVVTFDSAAQGGAALPSASTDDPIPQLLTPGSGTTREITEIIGWDQQRGQIRSWIFTSDGQFAEGKWSRNGDYWTVAVECGLPLSEMAFPDTALGNAGTKSTESNSSNRCTCTLTRIGMDEISVRHDGDNLVDLMPPACDFVRTARPLDAPQDALEVQ